MSKYNPDSHNRRISNHEKMLRQRGLNKQFYAPPKEEQEKIKRLYVNCPVGYYVDHIYPVAKGGLHCLSNLQYLTNKDNGRKGAKIPPNIDIDGTKILWS